MWGKRADMIVHAQSPFNSEPPAAVLADSAITAVDAFYTRNHGDFPDIGQDEWQCTVAGLVNQPLTLSYSQLTTDFPAHSVAATLVCAGNRRAELLQVHPMPGKEPWTHGAISTATWTGVRLADVLTAAGATRHDEPVYVAFGAVDEAPEARPVQTYGGSIPLRKALSEEVLLVWEMNGQPLPRIHGGPVRVVVPGYIGARSVKWLSSITVQSEPSDNYFQAVDYRILPPDSPSGAASAGDGIPLSSVPLNCDILAPADDAVLPAGPATVRGWALASDGRSIGRVDVSVDDGRTWRQAVLEPGAGRWAWTKWSLTVDVDPGSRVITARAWDDTGVTHPEYPASLWNSRGYANNAWARVTVSVG